MHFLYSIFDFFIEIYNPLLDLFLYLWQFFSGKGYIFGFIFVTILALIVIYKIQKLFFILAFLLFIEGLIGIFGVVYFNDNFKVLEGNTPINLEQRIIGTWCKGKNRIEIHSDHSIIINSNDISMYGIWSHNNAHIQVKYSNTNEQNLRIIGFKDELFINMSNPYPGIGNYRDLEYSICQ